MAKWRTGQTVYETLISNIGQYINHQTNNEYVTPTQAIVLAKSTIPEFVEGLTVKDLTAIHEYLMYATEIRSDTRVPAYVYSGGDRIISITRYLLKNIDHELAKQYA